MAHQPDNAIVVGVDGTDKDGRAIDWAAEEAARSGVGLHILFAFPAVGGSRAPVDVDADGIGARVTDWARDRARTAHPGLPVTTETVLDEPSTALVRASEGGSTVVLGARGLGRVAGRLLGSVSQKVTAHAHGVVVVVRDVPREPRGPVVVGVDPRDTAPEVLEFGFSQAAGRDVGLVLLRVVRPLEMTIDDYQVRRALAEMDQEASREFTELAEEWARRHPDVTVQVREVEGHPVEVLTEASADAGLLVVGSRGRRGLTGLRLGSVSRGVLHEVPAVAVVRVSPEPSPAP